MIRILFLGTGPLACPALKSLSGWSDCTVIEVITQPDRPAGRQLRSKPSAVKETASQLNLPVLQPERIRDSAEIERIRNLQPDLCVVASYGQILPPELLAIPQFGCLNIHASLLPRHRGAAPIQWAILDCDTESGVTIMRMDAGLDTGDIVATVRTPILPVDNSQTLHDRLALMGAQLLIETIPGYINGSLIPLPQPTVGATYARKIRKEDGHIDWTQNSQQILRRIRAFTPWPGTYTTSPHDLNSRLKIWDAEWVLAHGRPGEILTADAAGLVVACSEGALRLTSLQREGGRQIASGDFLRGSPLKPGDILG